MIVLTSFIFLSCCMKGVLSVVAGITHTVICPLNVTLPQWSKNGETEFITIQNDPDINSNFPAASRIAYASNNKDLIISSLISTDAGTYVCSVTTPTPQSDSVTFPVDVVSITGNGCPAEDSGFPFITCACATANDVIQEFKYIFLDYDNTQKKVCPKLEVTTNSTGCSAGTVQEIAGFKYHKGDSVCRKLKVNILGNLLHSTTGDTVHDSRNCTLDYHIDPCCCEWEIAGYVLFGTDVIILIIVAVIICCKFLNCREYCMWCICCFCTCWNVELLGDTYTVTCPFDVEYPCWKKDGVVIPGMKKEYSRRKYASNKKDLEIKNVNSGDAGTYICSNESVSKPQYYAVVVVLLGDTCTVTCPFDVEYPCWRKDGVDIPEMKNEDPRIKYAFNRKDLEIKNVKSGDAGTYICSTESRSSSQNLAVVETWAWKEIQLWICLLILVILAIVGSLIWVILVTRKWAWKEKETWICLLSNVIMIIVGSLIWVILVTMDPVLPDGELDECCDCTGRIVYLGFMASFTVIGCCLLIGVSCFPRETREERGEAPTDNPPPTSTPPSPPPPDNAGESTGKKRKKKKRITQQENPEKIHITEEEEKKRALPATPEEKKKKRPPADLNEPLQGIPVLPEIKNKPSGIDQLEYTPKPKVPPISTAQK